MAYRLDTPLGPLQASFSAVGLRALRFSDQEAPSETVPATWVEQLRLELDAYFRGELRVFSTRLDLHGTAFQLRVWNALRAIAWGERRTYTEQTAVLGDPLALRAVASANGKNPIAILVPCHRVLGADGSLTGYAGGLERKRALLQLEGWLPGGQHELF